MPPIVERERTVDVAWIFDVAGEKGRTWLTFDKDGTIQHYKDESISYKTNSGSFGNGTLEYLNTI